MTQYGNSNLLTLAIYNQRSRLGDKLIMLDTQHITLSGKFRGAKFDVRVELAKLSPQYERFEKRFPLLILFPLGLAVVTSVLGYSMVIRGWFSQITIVVVGFPLIGFLLWQAIKGFSPITVTRFRDKTGEMVFDILSEINQREECNRFVEELCAALPMK